MNNLSENLQTIHSRINAAAQRSGRTPDQIRLIAASKKQTADKLRQAVEAGQTTFGENRFQEGRAKIPQLPSHLEWHFIGGLQRNKVKDIVRLFPWIHSVDTTDLIDEIQKRAAYAGVFPKILIEINVGSEASKHGAPLSAAAELATYANQQTNIEIHGFMAVAPFYEDLEKVRPFFTVLREERDRVEAQTGLILPELSMGMTHDFETAIEEGATMIRVGTGIFGTRS